MLNILSFQIFKNLDIWKRFELVKKHLIWEVKAQNLKRHFFKLLKVKLQLMWETDNCLNDN